MSGALYDAVARVARHEADARAVASIGTVTSVHDGGGTPPDHAVTVQLRDSGLVLPRVPLAVGALGFAATPSTGDLVIVVFLEGDLNAPVCVGRLYHPDLDPPQHAAGELVLRLPAGEDEPKVDLVVTGATPAIELKLPGEVVVRIAEEKVEIAVGKLALKLGSGRAELAAGGSSLVLKEDGDVTLKATGNLKLEGVEVAASGQAKAALKAASVELN